ncbi:WXG100 family type VII secretion target [Nocardia brasiliensis]|uniref:PPE family domain-containing protein n=1 Tax=Nocardia brasiliensis (strain ATCC 700358 / HUJEG-1) TaxID=1133849 RepID=K0EKH6_NOCB7|nr:hypothetical protein [Nocardia brasiliensis]AFT99872.1 hypothetical protein O3I_009560 [Nocardia brasiliensis ATCC 700358]OCF87397.1 hypothetical protein AW168_25835 [Nocardia brasiliensis]
MSGYEPPRIPGGGEHTDSWDHPEIKDAFDPLDTTEAINQAERYWQMHQLWEQGVDTFARSIQNSIAQAWSGPAAEASKKSIQDYTTDALTLTSSLAELHTRVRDAATAIVNTKKAIPDPVIITWTSWLWPPNRKDLQSDQSEETQKARVAMNEHYVKPFSQIDGKIPVLPTPTSPTKAVDIPAPPPGGYNAENTSSGQPSQSITPGTDPGSTNSAVPGDTNGDGKPDEPGTTEPQTDPSKTGEQTNPASTTSPSSTQTPSSTAPSTQSPSTTDPAKTVPAGTGTPYTPGTPGTPGSPRTSGTPGSPGSPSTTPQPGRSIPGTGIPTTSGTSPTPAAAAATAARGAAGASGMGVPGAGARGKSEDDEEHKIPDYLITQENTDELLGEFPKTVPGGVIGGDIPT